MPSQPNNNLAQAIELANALIELAARGDRDACDDSCVFVYGLIRDCAFRIRNAAEKESHLHKHRNIAEG